MIRLPVPGAVFLRRRAIRIGPRVPEDDCEPFPSVDDEHGGSADIIPTGTHPLRWHVRVRITLGAAA